MKFSHNIDMWKQSVMREGGREGGEGEKGELNHLQGSIMAH